LKDRRETRKKGVLYHEIVNGEIFASNGQVAGAQGIARDITDASSQKKPCIRVKRNTAPS
jgi:hypothetical protein